MDNWEKMFIIVNGNPLDGFVYTGPFETADKAIEWAELTIVNDWWVVELEDTEINEDEEGGNKNAG